MRIILILYLPLFLVPVLSRSQEVLVIDSSLIHVEVPFRVFTTTNPDLQPDEVLTRDFLTKEDAGITKTDRYYWLLYDLEEFQDILRKSAAWQLEITPVDFASLFVPENGRWIERKFGFLDPVESYRPGIHYFSVPFRPEELIEDRYLLVRIRKVAVFMDMAGFRSRITASQVYFLDAGRYTWEEVKRALPNYAFAGSAGIVMLFALLFYLLRGRREFLYYSIYLAMLVIYLSRRALHWHDALFSEIPVADWIIHMQAQIAINLFYVLFVRYFLTTKTDYPLLDKAIRWIIVFLLITMITDLAAVLGGYYTLHIHTMNVHRAVMSLFALAGSVYLLWKRKDELVYFVVVGSLFFTIGALAMLFTSRNVYMIAGSFIETVTFGAGLAYKLQQISKQKQELQLASVRNELSAMKAQMNPHFIFNSLSSIQNLILSQDRRASLSYLAKFSRLLRRTLDSSVDSSHLLETEIDLLSNYLELESLRFSGDFSYSITVDPALENSQVEVPVFIIQPFVENAIVHGLKPSERPDKHLLISFMDADDHVICQVEDNGIGRTAAAALRKRDESHRSHGMAVTLKRLKMEGNKTSEETMVQIEDLQNNGTPGGTRVIIRIPKLI